MKFFVSALLLIGAASAARNGIDFIQPVSTATFQCIHKAGYSFVIPRVFTSVGTLDHTGIQNVKNARAGEHFRWVSRNGFYHFQNNFHSWQFGSPFPRDSSPHTSNL